MDYQNSVREFNNARILSLLRRHSPLSRADISRHTDLNRSTVSSIVEDLLGAGFVREIGLRQVSTGRPSIMLEIDTDHYGVLGLDVLPDAIHITLSDLLGKIIWQHVVSRSELSTGLETALEMAYSRVSRCNLTPAGIGVAVSPDAPEIRINRLLQRLSSQPSVPVFVEEQARAATIGQRYLGQARDIENFVYLTIDEGPKAVFVIDGRIYRGSTDHAGNIAHLPTGTSDGACRCGKQGCWNPKVNPESITHRLQSDQPFKAVVEAAMNGDERAHDEIRAMCQALGRGIAHIVSIVDPRMVVLGGCLSCLNAEHLHLIRAVATHNTGQHPWSDIDITLIEESDKVRHIGAISLVLNHLYQDLVVLPRKQGTKQFTGNVRGAAVEAGGR